MHCGKYSVTIPALLQYSPVAVCSLILSFEISQTKEKIDYEKLKIEEKILFFVSLLLFEDELADNGASILSLKFVSFQKQIV